MVEKDDICVGEIRAYLNEASRLCREEADRWYFNPETGNPIIRNHGEQFALIHSEISEAMEGYRKGLMDDKLPHRKMVEVELADALIRIFDYCGENNLDIGGALIEKLFYNRTREDHSHEHRLTANSKKF